MIIEDKDGLEPIHITSENGYFLMVGKLIESGADENAKNVYKIKPAYKAEPIGHLAVIIFLIEKGASIVTKNKSFLSPLDIARSRAKEIILIV